MAKFDIKLTAEAEKKLNDLAKAGKIDLRPSLNSIGISYRKEVQLIYDHQQPRNEGLRWPPLSESYRKWKERAFPGAPLLVRTGRLRKSMIQEGAQGNITVIGKTGATFGTSIHYGIYHDVGGSKVPQRNFSEPSDKRRQIWIDQIERNIAKNFEREGISIKGGIIQ